MLVENCNGRVCSTLAKVRTSRVDTSSYIYVPDGRTAEIKSFRDSDHAQIGSVKLSKDPDSIGYDPDTKHVTNGSGGPHLECAAPVSFLVFLLKASERGLSK